ncbi:YfiR family protein [Propionivibrio dicarboxylicus]|uniref:Transmembrane protein n=1 Tax=Propionivibrio dicarboxylicus TaxID=83767 RepID=A0A1G8G982_9RHOO|nr:YfiR family protein [Propionivibrio dicarboxylicus]SDH90850.1 protein of unknown function [Propionivibrio dicarboxylicus]
MPTRIRTFILGLLGMVSLACPATAGAQALQAPAPELKAAIIANMLLFVEWPSRKSITLADGSDQLTLCTLDDSPVAEALSRLNDRPFKGKTIKVNRISIDHLGDCHALYIAPADRSTLARIAPNNIGATPTLLIGDTPGFLLRGIMINLEQEGSRVAFDVDLRALQAAGLKISSKALRLARTIIE